MTDDSGKLWERQSWDTKASFVAFQYYLTQKPPRYLLRAYKAYRRERGLSEADIKKILTVPDLWERWAKGRDNKGQAIPGAISWEDRGHAFDDEVLWPARAKEWAAVSWQLTEAMAEKAAAMLDYPITEKTIREVDEEGRPVVFVVQPSKKWNFRTAVSLANQADKQARLNLGKPTSHTAISQGPDYSELSDEELEDAINRKAQQLGSLGDAGLTNPIH